MIFKIFNNIKFSGQAKIQNNLLKNHVLLEVQKNQKQKEEIPYDKQSVHHIYKP